LQGIFFLPEEIYLPAVKLDRCLSTMAPFYPNFDEDFFRRSIGEFDIPTGNKLTDMSYGQKKKVLIAFALATNTDVLLMDEPTNGLDIPSKGQFRRVVSTALHPDRLMLISTHQVRDIDNLIDHVIILDDRKIVLQHSLEDISERLHFGTYPTLDGSELYSEPTLRGYKAVRENLAQEESRVELEYLFNAAAAHPARIKALFATTPVYQPKS
jgi:ABC-2 type transport system ATP-binding protein